MMTTNNRRATARGASLLGATLLAFSLLAGLVQPAAAEAAPFATDRIAGSDRYSTSVAVSKAMPAGKVDTVFLAAGNKFPDALAAAPVAYGTGARMLLTHSSSLLPSTTAELRRLDPSRIYILGGPDTVSNSVITAARSATGAQVSRISGANRVETSLALARHLAKKSPITDVWITDGRGYADSLTVSTIAAREGHAIVLAQGEPASWMAAFSATVPASARIHIAGGKPSVPATFETLLRARHDSVRRTAGSDRWETSALLNERYTSTVAGKAIYLASGQKFPDGLSLAQLAAARDSTVYLAPQSCHYSDAVARGAARLGATRVIGAGGSNTLSASSLRLQQCGQPAPEAPTPPTTPAPEPTPTPPAPTPTPTPTPPAPTPTPTPPAPTPEPTPTPPAPTPTPEPGLDPRYGHVSGLGVCYEGESLSKTTGQLTAAKAPKGATGWRPYFFGQPSTITGVEWMDCDAPGWMPPSLPVKIESNVDIEAAAAVDTYRPECENGYVYSKRVGYELPGHSSVPWNFRVVEIDPGRAYYANSMVEFFLCGA